MFDFRQIALFCSDKRLWKHKLTIFSKYLLGAWPLRPLPGYTYDGDPHFAHPAHSLRPLLDTGLCEPLRSIRLNCQWMTKLKILPILQAQVCGCISAHPELPHQKTRRETSDASTSQLNQASWNKTVLKFGSGNQLNYLSILLLSFSLNRTIWKKSRHNRFKCAPHT